MADEDPHAEVDWGNVEEVGSDSDNDDDNDMDDSSEEDSDEEESDDMSDDEDDSSNSDVIDDAMVEKFIRSFSNSDYDIEFDNALTLDRNVTSSVRPTQALYIKPDNWIERNRLGLERVKGRLQTCINLVSRGKRFKLYLAHNNGWEQQLMDNEEPIVWHEAILDHYWDQLENEIDRRKQQEIVTDISSICISNVEMSKERLATLVTTLSGQVNKIETILFNNVNLCEEGIISLSKLVE